MPWLVCARCCRTCYSADLLQIGEIDLAVQDVPAAVEGLPDTTWRQPRRRGESPSY
jgi:hypothetical protein